MEIMCLKLLGGYAMLVQDASSGGGTVALRKYIGSYKVYK